MPTLRTSIVPAPLGFSWGVTNSGSYDVVHRHVPTDLALGRRPVA